MDLKGWTAYELAKQSGISANTVYDWNRKQTMPSLANVMKVCEAMEITMEQFFCGIESYQLTEEESEIIKDWFVLSKIEKDAILHMIETFKILKN